MMLRRCQELQVWAAPQERFLTSLVVLRVSRRQTCLLGMAELGWRGQMPSCSRWKVAEVREVYASEQICCLQLPQVLRSSVYQPLQLWLEQKPSLGPFLGETCSLEVRVLCRELLKRPSAVLLSVLGLADDRFGRLQRSKEPRLFA